MRFLPRTLLGLVLFQACAVEVADEAEIVGQEQALTGWRRTVVFIQGETQPGQDMFLRGGIDHDFAATQGKSCTAQNGLCAIPIRHRNTLNHPAWKDGDDLLDWYGRQAMQARFASDPSLVQGSPVDWTTNAWPASWGTVRSVDVDGYGVEPLNNK